MSRHMPSIQTIHEYWTLREPDVAAELFGQHAEDGPPTCYGCGYDPGRHKLYRAHLADHARVVRIDQEAADDPSNIVLLCRRCHDVMPSFGLGQRESAMQWVSLRESDVERACREVSEIVQWTIAHGHPPAYISDWMSARHPDQLYDMLRAIPEIRAQRGLPPLVADEAEA